LTTGTSGSLKTDYWILWILRLTDLCQEISDDELHSI